MQKKGKIICIEGIDKAGKTTQTAMLQEWLIEEKGYNVPFILPKVLSFPVYYDSDTGRLIRYYLDGKTDDKKYNQFMVNTLYSANRYEHKWLLDKWIAQGRIIILNRYTYSNIAYGAFKGDTEERIEWLDSGLPEPDIGIILDINPTITQERNNNQDRNERDLGYLEKVRQNYLDMAGKYLKTGFSIRPLFHVVNANQPKEQVHKEIVKIIEINKKILE